jgi:hypothetical protein
LEPDILSFLDKHKTPRYCRLRLPNPHHAPIVAHIVPTSNLDNLLIPLYICTANQTKSRTQDMACGFFNNPDKFILIDAEILK